MIDKREKLAPKAFRERLEIRTREFAIAVFRMIDQLPGSNSMKVVAYQLGKSASSIGANYREANRGESRDDFGHKIQIVVKEAAESCYWLEILHELEPANAIAKNLMVECLELRNLFQSIAKSIRTKANSRA